MRRLQDSPTRPSVLETNVDFPPPLTINGDLNRMTMGSGGPINGNNKRVGSTFELDNDAESATPTDTMLTQASKSRLPEDEEENHHHHHHHHHIRPNRVQRTAAKYGVTSKGLGLLICFGGLVIVLSVTLFSMIAMWPRDAQNIHQEVCLTPDCLRASAEASIYFLDL